MNNPRIRFKGYTDAWQQRKVSDIFKITRGYVLAATETSSEIDDDNKYPVYSSQTKNEGLMGYYKEYLYENSITWTTDGANAGTVKYRDGKFYCTNVCGVLLSDEGYANKAVAEILNLVAWKYVSHIGNPKLMNNVMSDIEIMIPKTVAEQETISKYFDKIDNIITLHQRKYEETKTLKKYMLQKMFPQNGMSVPEIRFDGFTNAWEQRKFKDIFDVLQNNTVSRAELNYENGVAKNVHYGDVLIKFGDYIDASCVELPFFNNESIVEKYSGSLLQDGDIIIADTAEDTTAGKCTEIQGSEGMILISGLHTIPCRPKEKYAPKFMGYYINSSAYHNQLIPLMQGTKVTSISKGALQETDLLLPKSFKEQEKIGIYFSDIDHIITLHQRKCDELQNIKKYMLQNMFI